MRSLAFFLALVCVAFAGNTTRRAFPGWNNVDYIQVDMRCDHHGGGVDLSYQMTVVGSQSGSTLYFNFGKPNGDPNKQFTVDSLQVPMQVAPSSYSITNPKQGKYCEGVTGNPNLYIPSSQVYSPDDMYCECWKGGMAVPCSDHSVNAPPGMMYLGRCNEVQSSLPWSPNYAEAVDGGNGHCYSYTTRSIETREPAAPPTTFRCTHPGLTSMNYYCQNNQESYIHIYPAIILNPVLFINIDGGGDHDAADSDWMASTTIGSEMACFDKKGSVSFGVTGNPTFSITTDQAGSNFVWDYSRCNEHRPPEHIMNVGDCDGNVETAVVDFP